MFCPDLMLISSGGVVASEKLTSATSSHTLKARSKHFLRHFLVMVETVQYQYWLSVHMQESYFPTEDPKTTASQWTKMSTVQIWQWLTWPSQCQSGFWQSDLGTVPRSIEHDENLKSYFTFVRNQVRKLEKLWGKLGKWFHPCEEPGEPTLVPVVRREEGIGSSSCFWADKVVAANCHPSNPDIPKLEEHPRKQLTVRSSTLWCRGVSTVWNIRTF